jgi:hypothetical protein
MRKRKDYFFDDSATSRDSLGEYINCPEGGELLVIEPDDGRKLAFCYRHVIACYIGRGWDKEQEAAKSEQREPDKFMESTKNDPLIGLRVHVGIDEDGHPDPPKLPNGTITGKLAVRGTRYHLYIVHLDEPVRYLRPPLNFRPPIPRDWILTDLTIQPRYEGHDLDLLLTKPEEAVIVMITNHSNGVYFAIGGVRLVSSK